MAGVIVRSDALSRHLAAVVDGAVAGVSPEGAEVLHAGHRVP